MTQRTLVIGYGLLLWCNVGITSARVKAFRLRNNTSVARAMKVLRKLG